MKKSKYVNLKTEQKKIKNLISNVKTDDAFFGLVKYALTEELDNIIFKQWTGGGF